MSICPRCSVRSRTRSLRLLRRRRVALAVHVLPQSVGGLRVPVRPVPYCKGKLEMLERGELEGDEAYDAIRKAFEIELGGHAFYQRASRDAEDRCCETCLRASRGDGAGAHGNAVAALPCELPAPSADFQIDRARSSPASIASRRTRQPVPDRHRVRAARGGLLLEGRERAPEGSVERELYRSSPRRSASMSRC